MNGLMDWFSDPYRVFQPLLPTYYSHSVNAWAEAKEKIYQLYEVGEFYKSPPKCLIINQTT